jgi:HlyD family secretion protein
MAGKWIKRVFASAFLAAIAGVFIWLLWPQPQLADVATAFTGHMELTVDEEGVNRIRDVYVVSAPVSGKIERSMRKVGDHVSAGNSRLASIRPADPTMIDERTRLELTAAIEAAKADEDSASAAVLQAERELKFAEGELARTKYLVTKKVQPLVALERRQLDADGASEKLKSTKAVLDARVHSREMVEARLRGYAMAQTVSAEAECCITVNAPVNGTVLKIPVENEQVVQAGTPLMEIGNPLQTEIAVDLLSTDAVNVRPGARARISGWGGSQDINARVRRIDPAAFTKVSALGIEEQRVKVVLDIADPPMQWTGLGHEYRVFASIVVWQSDNALQVPLGALFRQGGKWAVFKVVDGRAKIVLVEIGHMNASQAEVLGGLANSAQVIVHPGDLIADGTRVEVRRLPAT